MARHKARTGPSPSVVFHGGGARVGVSTVDEVATCPRGGSWLIKVNLTVVGPE
jgi:hypothetical protein